MGKGDKESADFAACDAIRGLFDTVNISGLVTIGEGIKDGAPGIFKGEKLGTWAEGTLQMAIAIDPIDGTTIVSKGLPGAIAVMAAASCEKAGDDPKTLLADVPSFYMNKISFGPRVKAGPGRIRLGDSVQDNLEIAALKLGKRVQDLTVVILDRPRHERLIHDVRRGRCHSPDLRRRYCSCDRPVPAGIGRRYLHGHRRLSRSRSGSGGNQMPRRRNSRADVATG